MKAILLIILTAAMFGCAKHKPQPPPAPPTITPAAKAPKKQPAPAPAPIKAGDMIVHNCTLAKVDVSSGTNGRLVANGKVDCICRSAVTHIDIKNGQQPSLICK